MTRICVFTGSSPGALDAYAASARELARVLVSGRHTLVYGGAKVGLMGVLADAVIAGGGEVIGVIPAHLEAKEVAHRGLSELRVVGSMHERKAVMAELSDGVIALPGGLGTLEELFEMLTWAQLGLHGKPCGVLNVAGYFDRLLQFLDHAVDQRFISELHRGLLLSDDDPTVLVDRMMAYQVPNTGKWLDRDTS
jgi:uncharacterized protein (TIGR00730 family)